MSTESAWASKLHNEFSQVIDSDRLVEQCQGNQLAAGLATVEYCRTVIARLPTPRRQQVNPQQFSSISSGSMRHLAQTKRQKLAVQRSNS